MEDVKALLQAGKIKEAFAAFRTLPENQQEGFFREIAPTLRPPVLIDVLYRKIKPGYTYDDFREAWLPSLKPGQDLEHYFPALSYVLNAENRDDHSDIISVGFGWLEEDKLDEIFKNLGDTEKMRHDKIAAVADKVGSLAVYKVKEVVKLGS